MPFNAFEIAFCGRAAIRRLQFEKCDPLSRWLVERYSAAELRFLLWYCHRKRELVWRMTGIDIAQPRDDGSVRFMGKGSWHFQKWGRKR